MTTPTSSAARISQVLRLALAGCLLLSDANVFADPLFEFLEEEAKVVTASKTEEKLSEAPGVISVITKEEIASYGAVSLVDVLNRAPGIQHMSSHLMVDAKPVIRGALFTHSDNQVLVLINGRPFRDAYGMHSNFTVYKAFPVDMIERIEIVRGPGSVLYGSNAVAGVINVITRKPSGRARAEATAGGGSFGAKFGSASLFAPGRDWNLSVGTNYFSDDGWNYDPATNHPAAGIKRGQMRYGETDKSVAASFDYKRFTAQTYVGDVTYDALGTIPHWPVKGFVHEQRAFVDAGYVQPLWSEWDLKVNLGVNDLHQDGPRQTISINRSAATLLEAAASGRIGTDVNLIVGGTAERRENYHVDTSARKYEEDLYSAYAQCDRKFWNVLKLVGGAQYNHDAADNDALVPRAGAIYAINDAVSLKLQYAQAFRTPSPLEKYFNTPGSVIGNSDLAPERVTTYDAQFFVRTAKSQYGLTYFRTRFKDLIERMIIVGGGGTATFINLGEASMEGVELEGKTRLTRRTSLSGSAAVVDRERQPIYIPGYMAKAGLSYQGDRFGWGLFHSHFAKPLKNNPLGGLELNEPAKAIDLLSLNVSCKFRSRVPTTLTVYGSNLLGDSMNYTEFARGWVNTLPIGAGRAVYGKLSVEF